MAQMLKEYTHVRIVRSDGNEFYRAIPFAVIESSIQGNAPGKLYALSDKSVSAVVHISSEIL